ncbi:MAG: amino acid permease [Streptosporangiales bacterium]|nr:amino acid permease [Streptosporangiales bacterium]
MAVGVRDRNTVLRRLPVEEATGRPYGGRHRLRRVYQRKDLIVLGLGVMIGSGIFTIAGVQAATMAGPAVIVSFVIAGFACLLSALSYAELSSTMPVAGSAYSFSYVIFGELWAWVIGWSLILEMLLAAAAVSRAWSLYALETLHDFGVQVPSSLEGMVGQPTGFDLLTLLILVLLTAVVALGARMGLGLLWFLVLAKVVVIGLVIVVGLPHVETDNYTPFVPPTQPSVDPTGGTVFGALLGTSPGAFGLFGVFAATSVIAFSYLGFDILATAAEETADAPRDIPRGMLGSLGLTILLYLGVAVVMVGMVRYDALNEDASLAAAFRQVGAGTMGRVIDVGAVLGLTTVVLVVLVGLTRVVFSIARDGLLPRGLAAVDRRYGAPTRAAVVIGIITILLSQFVDVLTLQQLVVIGTLFAFVFVSAGVLVLRRTHPEVPRGFRVPGVPVVPVLAIVVTCWLMLNMTLMTWAYFAAWMALGALIYAIYGRRHSALAVVGGRPARRRGRHAGRRRL